MRHSGTHTLANRNAPQRIDQFVKKQRGQFRSNDLATAINNTYRSCSYTPNRVGQFLRMRDDLRHIRNGVWERVTA